MNRLVAGGLCNSRWSNKCAKYFLQKLHDIGVPIYIRNNEFKARWVVWLTH